MRARLYVELNQEGNLARYTAAGQPPPLLWRRGEQRLDPLDSAGLLLGVRREEPYDDNTLHFAKGDRLLIYSDGLTEAENGRGESFGDTVLPEFFVREQDLSAETFAEALLQSVLSWSAESSGPGQADDITFVIVDFNFFTQVGDVSGLSHARTKQMDRHDRSVANAPLSAIPWSSSIVAFSSS